MHVTLWIRSVDTHDKFTFTDENEWNAVFQQIATIAMSASGTGLVRIDEGEVKGAYTFVMNQGSEISWRRHG